MQARTRPAVRRIRVCCRLVCYHVGPRKWGWAVAGCAERCAQFWFSSRWNSQHFISYPARRPIAQLLRRTDADRLLLCYGVLCLAHRPPF